MTLAAIPTALTFDRITNGLTRPFFGWVSDHIGRENTMAIAFLTGAGALLLLSQFGTNPLAFVLVTALYFGVFGEIYSLFPATQGDTFGARYAAANAGMLYTAKGTAALIVPTATAMAATLGWNAIFKIAMGCNLVAAALALLVLKPMRAKHFERIRATAASGTAPGVAAPSTT
jgi:MFS transporter, OFA family, oxalate/formate antiporter